MATRFTLLDGLWARWRRRGLGREAPLRPRAHEENIPWSPYYDDDADDDDFSGRLPQPGAPVRVEPAKGGRTRWWWAKRALQAFGAFLGILILWLAITAPLSKSLQPIVPPQMTLLAADGTPIARNGGIVDQPVTVADLPPHVVEALLAIEDRRFYSHWGIDPYGIGRAIWTNLTSDRTQGGSTITQQLAKFTFLTADQNMTRKAREAFIALWLEAWLSKDEILERYLSNAYFGDNTYGLRAASLHYFYRKPENLTLAQSAMLMGMLQAPSALAPTNNPERAERRMRLVLRAMVDAGYLTAEEAAAVETPRVDVRNRNNLPTGTYFADWALPQARELVEASYARQTITTTLDSRLQNIARRAVNRAGLGDAQVALVAMRTNGEVVAMIGGRDYEKSPFNRATQARRQPGSTFKLFVYLAALEAGMELDDTVSNLPFEAGSYRPRNSGGRYTDSMLLRDAFAQSSNVVAVRLLQQVGDDAVIEMARDLGITSPLAEGDPSLALGTSTVTLLELTAAYAGVAGNSFPVEPTAFRREEGGWFSTLFDGKSSLRSHVRGGMDEMLRQAINRGTGRAAMLSGPNFGKTGTTQDNRDALFVGYAGDLVVGVWIGNDDNSPLRGISGGGLPAQIWRAFMAEALGETAPRRPRPTESPDPQGPVQPLDIPEMPQLPQIPLGDSGASLNIDRSGASISGNVDGVDLDFRIDGNGLRVEPAPPGEPASPP
jgi:penicillin-binding protein 1A